MAIGIPASIAAGYTTTTKCFEQQPYSPAILIVTTLVLSLVAFVASPVTGRASLEASRALRMA